MEATFSLETAKEMVETKIISLQNLNDAQRKYHENFTEIQKEKVKEYNQLPFYKKLFTTGPTIPYEYDLSWTAHQLSQQLKKWEQVLEAIEKGAVISFTEQELDDLKRIPSGLY